MHDFFFVISISRISYKFFFQLIKSFFYKLFWLVNWTVSTTNQKPPYIKKKICKRVFLILPQLQYIYIFLGTTFLWQWLQLVLSFTTYSKHTTQSGLLYEYIVLRHIYFLIVILSSIILKIRHWIRVRVRISNQIEFRSDSVVRAMTSDLKLELVRLLWQKN